MEINKLTDSLIPPLLQELSDAPKMLFSTLTAEELASLLQRPRVAIVGSRKVTAYGRRVTAELAAKLAAQGIVIISGLALGADAIAHQAALDAGGTTIAALPSPLERIYPSSHRDLAAQITKRGGALLSEYPRGTDTYPWSFVARNRIIAALSQAVIITEAAEKSGSLHTANFALEQGKDVLAVPGNITSETSKGTNNLIKAGAAPVTSYKDVLAALGLHEHDEKMTAARGANPAEQAILELLLGGTADGEALQRTSKLDIALFNQTLTMLELSGKVRSLGSNQWTLS